MAITHINGTMFGRLYTSGRTYFETTFPHFKYNENFKLGNSYGSFFWVPSKINNTYYSSINIVHNNTHYNEELLLFDYKKPIIKKYNFLINDIHSCKKLNPVTRQDFLQNLENYEVIECDCSYIIMK